MRWNKSQRPIDCSLFQFLATREAYEMQMARASDSNEPKQTRRQLEFGPSLFLFVALLAFSRQLLAHAARSSHRVHLFAARMAGRADIIMLGLSLHIHSPLMKCVLLYKNNSNSYSNSNSSSSSSSNNNNIQFDHHYSASPAL